MHWAYSIKSKMRVAVLLFVVMATILVNHFSMRSQSAKIQEAIASIYKDRFMVERYLFDYAQNLQHIAEVMDDEHQPLAIQQQLVHDLLDETKVLKEAYINTELTQLERLQFTQLMDTYADIDRYAASGAMDSSRRATRKAQHLLNSLSDIQVAEAHAQMNKINRINSSTALYARFELVILLLIGLMIQALVLASRSIQGLRTEGLSQYN